MSPLLSKLPDLAPGDDLFLDDMFARFPRVEGGFRGCVETTPFMRIPRAAKNLETLPRTGWLKFEAQEGHRPILNTHAPMYYGPRWLFAEMASGKTETVLEHCAEGGELHLLVYHQDPNRQWGNEVIKFHDFTEDPCGDFTPHDKITKSEKKRLEKIALNLLTEDRKNGNLHALHVYNCARIYEGEATDFAPMRAQMLGEIDRQRRAGTIRPHQVGVVGYFEKLYRDFDINLPQLTAQVHDIDALHMGVRATRIARDGHYTVPKAEVEAGLKEFYDYIGKKLHTPEAKAFFASLQETNREAPNHGYRAAMGMTLARFHHG